VFTKRFLVALAMVAGSWFGSASAGQAQSYFYGYYYPQEHRFNSSMLNTGVFNYTTVTPMWNAANDSRFGYPSRPYMVPTTSPLPTTSPIPSPNLLGTNPAAAPANFGASRPYMVPTTSPLPTTSLFPSPNLLGMNPTPTAPANIRVVLPSATANVWFEGHSTQTTGTDRVYLSPPIASGNTYSYQIKAAWMEGDRQVVQERTIAVGAGQTAVLDFTQTLSARK
jgi:uncharacterized protein (TIGR03000 family)